MILAHNVLAALSLAISIKKSVPIAKKKESLGAKSSTSRPFDIAALTYSIPSAKV